MRRFLLPFAAALLLANGSPVERLVGAGRNEEAFALALAEAINGDGEAHDWLGHFYEEGLGTERDLAAAERHYRIAAEADRDHARWRLGLMIDEGMIDGSLEEAVRLFRAAAGNGFSNGMVSLAVMQATGRGTPADHGAAMRNYLAAARLGNSHGVQGVGVLHALGQGVDRDLGEAVAWLLLAQAMGNETASAYLDQITVDIPTDVLTARTNAIASELGFEMTFVADPDAI